MKTKEGICLGSVHRIVDDYGGEMQVSHEESVFNVRISIRYRERS